MASLLALGKQLGYQFNDIKLLNTALTHCSSNGNHNERLEFLGDAVVNMLITESLYQQFPQAREGDLTRLRASLVNGSTLSQIARELDIGSNLILGQGERKTGGVNRPSILEDAMEAVIAAIYLDGGMTACRQCVLNWFKQRLDHLSLEINNKDPKTQLQEHLQARQMPLPIYRIDTITGDAPEQIFRILCQISCLNQPLFGAGPSRRKAEQQAAVKALVLLDKEPDGRPGAPCP